MAMLADGHAGRGLGDIGVMIARLFMVACSLTAFYFLSLSVLILFDINYLSQGLLGLASYITYIDIKAILSGERDGTRQT